MARYGAEYLKWAPFKASGADESEVAFPKYDTPLSLGTLVVVDDDPVTDDVEDYGDNGLQEFDGNVTKINIAVEVNDLPAEAACPVLGAHLTEAQDIEYGDSTNPPWGGLAFLVNRRVQGKDYFQGVYYPKVKASRTGTTYNTRKKSMSFDHDKLRMVGTKCLKGVDKVESKRMTSRSEAVAWVDAQIKATV